MDDVCEPRAAFGDVIGSRNPATLDPPNQASQGTQVPIPLCCNVRTNAREPVREATCSTCSIGFSPSGSLAASADVSSPASPGLSLFTTAQKHPAAVLLRV